MRASPPFIASPRFRPTAVVLIIFLILLTNTACDFGFQGSVNRGTPPPIKYHVHLLAEDPNTNSLVYHSDLREVSIHIELQDSGLIIKQNKSDSDGIASLVIPNNYAQQTAKLVVNTQLGPIKKNVVLGGSPSEWEVIFYNAQEPHYRERLASATTQQGSAVAEASETTHASRPYRHTADFTLYGLSNQAGTGDLQRTVLPTPTPQPTWQLIATEDFSPPRHDWQITPIAHETGSIFIDIRQGTLRQIGNFVTNGTPSRLKYPTPLQPTSHDIQFSLDIAFAPSPPETNTTAVILLHQFGSHETGDECYYAITINQQGQYQVSKKRNNIIELLTPIETYPLALPNQETPVRVNVTIVGDTLTLDINGVPINDYNIFPRLQPGTIWLGLEGQTNHVGTVDIDNITLSQLEN